MDWRDAALRELLAVGIADGFADLLESDAENDRNGEYPANVADGLFAIARGLHDVADAVRGPLREGEG